MKVEAEGWRVEIGEFDAVSYPNMGDLTPSYFIRLKHLSSGRTWYLQSPVDPDIELAGRCKPMRDNPERRSDERM